MVGQMRDPFLRAPTLGPIFDDTEQILGPAIVTGDQQASLVVTRRMCRQAS
jgi:hypothetical protein